MRKPRMLFPDDESGQALGYYHCTSRVIGREHLFGPEEKDYLRRLMRESADFSGCHVLSLTVMSNHYHLVIEVPPMPEGGLTDTELLRRLEIVMKPSKVARIAAELAAARAKGDDEAVAALHTHHCRRMYSLSQFMKMVLEKFTPFVNRRHGRRGPLFEGRFKSTMIDKDEVARIVARYVDLNPVRANMVDDPTEYRWSSFADAQKGDVLAQAGLARLLSGREWMEGGVTGWEGLGEAYRDQLLGLAAEIVAERNKGDAASDAPEARPASEHKSTMVGMLGHRQRIFTDGGMVGSKAFVEKISGQLRERIGAKRNRGPQPLESSPEAAEGTLCSLVKLRKEVI